MLSPAAVALIREHAREAEQQGELHPEVLALIYEQQWFRAMVPHRFGGLGWPLPAVVRLEEELARVDGAVAWTVTLCSGAGWFAGFFPASELDRVFAHPRMCIAGSGMAAGRAERLPDGGYRVNGQWGYANCVIWADGAPVPGEDGQSTVLPFLFLREEVEVLDDWRAVGLVATGSHGFVVKELEVPAERCFVIDDAIFLPLAEATLAVNSCGMAGHFVECFEEVFEKRKGHLTKAVIEGATVILESTKTELARIRDEFYRALDAAWTSGGPYDAVSRTSHTLAAVARQWVDRLYPYAGLGAANVESEINRVWRDLHTASQHPLLISDFAPQK
jgi:alkylation response protein AidB-like acyl-CoA dehydrogenase